MFQELASTDVEVEDLRHLVDQQRVEQLEFCKQMQQLLQQLQQQQQQQVQLDKGNNQNNGNTLNIWSSRVESNRQIGNIFIYFVIIYL